MPLLREAQTRRRSPSSSPLSSIGNIWAREAAGWSKGGLAVHISKALCGEMTFFITRNTQSRLSATSWQSSNCVRSWNLQTKRGEGHPEPSCIISENSPLSKQTREYDYCVIIVVSGSLRYSFTSPPVPFLPEKNKHLQLLDLIRKLASPPPHLLSSALEVEDFYR